ADRAGIEILARGGLSSALPAKARPGALCDLSQGCRATAFVHCRAPTLPSDARRERSLTMAVAKITRTKDFVVDAAAFILEQARKAIAERNEFRIALSGGHTPAPVYAHIASGTRDFRWESVRFTFGDERCVPPEDPQS